MGGNAIKIAPTRRFTKAEYDELCLEVHAKFKAYNWRYRYHIIDSYFEKSDFGDMDILVEKAPRSTLNGTTGTWLPVAFIEMFPSKEVVTNGDVISLEYKGFQLDFIQVSGDIFNFAKTYFAWNDLGNLMGKTARRMGLKYGWQGLSYTLRDGIGDKVGEIPVTKIPEEAVRFLGYDWDRMQKGFKNLEEIFEFTASSKYFDPNAYSLENLNHVDRIRDKKRTTYQEFLTWLDKNGKKEPGIVIPDPSYYLHTIRRSFPEFAMKYDLLNAQVAKRAKVRQKFNGDIVSEITGLKGKDLGDFMREFRAWFVREEDLHDYVLYVSSPVLKLAISDFHGLLIKKKILS